YCGRISRAVFVSASRAAFVSAANATGAINKTIARKLRERMGGIAYDDNGIVPCGGRRAQPDKRLRPTSGPWGVVARPAKGRPAPAEQTIPAKSIVRGTRAERLSDH